MHVHTAHGRRCTEAASAAACLVDVPACSSSSDDSAEKAPTKAEFLKAADAICKKGSAEIDKKSDAVDQTNKDDVNTFVIAASKSTLAQITKVRALGLPTADADKLDTALGAYEDVFKGLIEDPEMISEAASPETKKAQATMKAYGFKECGV